MEHPHEHYHVRPFPQQPKRGGKELTGALSDLEAVIADEVPDLAKLREIQVRIHATTSHFNDDRLIDHLRMLSSGIDQYLRAPSKSIGLDLAEKILRIRMELKRL